jgi:hypothetical protein
MLPLLTKEVQPVVTYKRNRFQNKIDKFKMMKANTKAIQ